MLLYEMIIPNAPASLEMKASSTAVKDLTVSKLSSKKGPDTESKVLPCLPLPPRIESQRKTRQTNVDLCKKEVTSNTTYAIQLRHSIPNEDSNAQLSVAANLQQTRRTSGMHSPDLRRNSTNSITPSLGNSLVKLLPEPSNDSIVPAA